MNAAVPNNITVLNRDRQERLATCQACPKKTLCPAAGRPEGLGDGQPTQRVIQPGRVAFEAGQRFEGLYIVRSGSFKSCFIDTDGTMQVTGFYLPGEFFGMDGMETGVHREYVEALDTSSVCRIPLDALGTQDAANDPAAQREWSMQLMHKLVKLMSMTISRDHQMFFTLGRMPARQRLGTFLADLAQRVAKGGYSSTEFRLCMSRTDIANHLGLALETVSRLFTQLQSEGAIDVDRRDVHIRDVQLLLQPECESAAPARRSCAR